MANPYEAPRIESPRSQRASTLERVGRISVGAVAGFAVIIFYGATMGSIALSFLGLIGLTIVIVVNFVRDWFGSRRK